MHSPLLLQIAGLLKEDVAASVLDGTIKFQPLRPIDRPKSRGGTRRVYDAPEPDKAVYRAIYDALAPHFTPHLPVCQFGCGAGRGPEAALFRFVDARNRMPDGYTVAFDVASCFPSIRNRGVTNRLERDWKRANGSPFPTDVRHLIRKVMRQYPGERKGVGLAQGCSLVPLLVGLVLAPLASELSRHFQVISYIDDFRLVCDTRARAEEALRFAQGWLERHGLKISYKDAGARIEPNRSGGEFLGWDIDSDGTVAPSWSAVQRTLEKIREKVTTGEGVVKIANYARMSLQQRLQTGKVLIRLALLLERLVQADVELNDIIGTGSVVQNPNASPFYPWFVEIASRRYARYWGGCRQPAHRSNLESWHSLTCQKLGWRKDALPGMPLSMTGMVLIVRQVLEKGRVFL